MTWILKLFGGGKFMWWVIGLLVVSTAASAALAKRYYDKNLVSGEQLELAVTMHKAQKDKLEEALERQKAQQAALSEAFTKQQEDYARSRREANRLRRQIRDLSKESPEVREWLTTRVPDDLYQRVFAQSED